MLTRLQVQGFKNLIDVDVRFGPFTCIAGANGVGKSNIFDAILFLSELADKPLVEAVRAIRGGENPSGIFAAHGEKTMSLAAEMLIPWVGEDDFGQRAEASATFVRYELGLRLEREENQSLRERIRLDRELLTYIKTGEAKKRIAFEPSKEWLGSVFRKSPRTRPFISTEDDGIVRLHADRMQKSGKDKRGGGKPFGFAAATLPRTVLSSANNSEETRTAVLVRQEMRNWRLLQLEPTAMRQPDDFQSPGRMTTTGGHIPATLFRIASSNGDPQHEGRIYARVANRLAELVEGVRRVRVEKDEARKALILMMTDRFGLELPASALSDGTMRFIALTVLLQDPSETGLICLEEPENGIHPQRIDAMLQLLGDIAVDADNPVDEENPLRQIIFNTHSPLVAGRVAEGDLIFASVRSKRVAGRRVPELALAALDKTWRAESETPPISKGRVLSYLQGASPKENKPRHSRVIDRFKDQLALPFE